MPSRVLSGSAMPGYEYLLSSDDVDDVMGSTSGYDIWKEFETTPDMWKPPLLTPPRSPLFEVMEETEQGLMWSRGLKNDLQHDCMWSGQCSENCKQRTVSRPRTKSVSDEGCCNPLAVCDRDPTFREDTPVSVPVKCQELTDSYTPLSDHSYYQMKEQRRSNSPVVIGSDTPSDSDSEIDVVTVQAAKIYKEERSFKQCGRRNAFDSKRRADCAGVVSSSSSSSSSSSRSSSDSEDTEKRCQHNHMERKRRDDLRYAFQHLRDNVPDLRDNSKAPKVLILSRATAYVRQLTSTGTILERTLRCETKKKSDLEKRLRQLKQSLQ